MGKRCCVTTCRAESVGGCGISFHGFPKNREMYYKWVEAVPSKVTASSVVCGLHFRPEDFNHPVSNRKYLKPDAVPSVFEPIRPALRRRQRNTMSIGADVAKVKKVFKEKYIEDDDNYKDYGSGDHDYIHFGKRSDEEYTNSQDSEDVIYIQNTGAVGSTSRCKCCLGISKLKGMWQKQCTGELLDYGTMLIECFALPWSKPKNSKSSRDQICESCIGRLTAAIRFKAEVMASERLLRDLDESNEQPDDENVLFDVTTEYLDYEYIEENLEDDFDDLVERDDKEEALDDGSVLDEAAAATDDEVDARDDCDKVDVCEDNIDANDDTSLACDKEEIEYGEAEIITIPQKRKTSDDDVTEDEVDSKDSLHVLKRSKGSNQDIYITKDDDVSFKIDTTEKIIKKKTMGYLEDILRYSNATPIGRHSDTGFQCCFCRDRYDSPMNLKHHTLYKHPENVIIHSQHDHIKLDITDLRCLDCYANVNSIQDFVSHMQMEHRMKMRRGMHYPIVPFKLDSPDTMKCALCQMKFDSFDSLNRHMDVHFEDYETHDVAKREVEDDEVEETLESSPIDFEELKREEDADGDESGDVKFKCMTCSWAFENRRSLLVHMNKYHLNLPIKCQYCDSKFLEKKELTRHVMVKHSGMIA